MKFPSFSLHNLFLYFQYFQYKFRNTSLPNFIDYKKPELQTEIQSMFENYLALTAMLTNVIFNFFTALLVKRYGVIECYSIK